MHMLSPHLEGEEVAKPDFNEGKLQMMTPTAAMTPTALLSQHQTIHSIPHIPVIALQPTHTHTAPQKASAGPTAPPAQVWTSSVPQHTHCEHVPSRAVHNILAG